MRSTTAGVGHHTRTRPADLRSAPTGVRSQDGPGLPARAVARCPDRQVQAGLPGHRGPLEVAGSAGHRDLGRRAGSAERAGRPALAGSAGRRGMERRTVSAQRVGRPGRVDLTGRLGLREPTVSARRLGRQEPAGSPERRDQGRRGQGGRADLAGRLARSAAVGWAETRGPWAGARRGAERLARPGMAGRGQALASGETLGWAGAVGRGQALGWAGAVGQAQALGWAEARADRGLTGGEAGGGWGPSRRLGAGTGPVRRNRAGRLDR